MPFRLYSQIKRFNATLQITLATTAEHFHWDWDLMIPQAVTDKVQCHILTLTATFTP